VKSNDRVVFLKTKVTADKEEALSPQGRRKILTALEAFKAGNYKGFDTVEDLIKELNA
jgi:hypothetical protein